MTGASNVKLLPPPKWLLEGFTDPTIEILCDYTRACVAHATAAKDAEIEALRAKLDGARARLEDVGKVTRFETVRAERLQAELREAWSAVDSKAGWEWKKRAEQAETRAERLAEALRFYADTNNWIGRFVTDPTTPAEEDGGDNARESLRDQGADSGESDG